MLSCGQGEVRSGDSNWALMHTDKRLKIAEITTRSIPEDSKIIICGVFEEESGIIESKYSHDSHVTRKVRAKLTTLGQTSTSNL